MGPRSLLLGGLAAAGLALGAADALPTTHGAVPTLAAFAPATLSLGAGQSATVQLTAAGLTPGDIGAQFRITHDRTRSSFTQPTCVGGWAGADVLLSVDTSNTWLVCVFLPGQGPASTTSGPVLSVTVTNIDGSAQDLVLNPAFTYFLLGDNTAAEFPATAEFPTTLGGLALRPAATPTATATGTGTATETAIATSTITRTPAATETSTRITLPGTATLTALLTGTPTGTATVATPSGTPGRTRPPTETPQCEARVRVGNQEYWAPQPATVCGALPARGGDR